MALRWSDDLTTNLVTLDAQHKEIMARMNQFYDACQQAKGRGELKPMLDFLMRYVEGHFMLEESYMRRHKYRDMEIHKESHDYFRRKVKEFAEKMEADGPSIALIVGMSYMLGDWWSDHIKGFDKSMAKFLREQQVGDLKAM